MNLRLLYNSLCVDVSRVDLYFLMLNGRWLLGGKNVVVKMMFCLGSLGSLSGRRSSLLSSSAFS